MTMKMKSIYLCLTAAACLWLAVSCIKEDTTAAGDTRNVSMAMNVTTRAGSEMQAGIEDNIHSLRVYAFWGETQIGYYYTGNVTTDEQGTVSFVMDLALPSFSGYDYDVRFYIVANETAVDAYGGDTWSEKMTKTALENYRFMELDATATRTSLPMAIVHEVEINPGNVVESTEHPGHWMWNGGPITFSLERAVAKLGMFFAKKNDAEGATLIINSIEVLPAGLRDYNYMFQPTQDKLQSVPQNWQNGFSIGHSTPLTVDKIVTDNEYNPNVSESDVPELAEQYNDGLPQPAYMFENCYGADENNPNTWGTADTGHKGFVVRVTYTVNGNQSQKDIFLPPTERNTYYCVLNRIGINGVVSVVYSVADWDDGGNVDIEWGFPTFTFDAVGNEDCIIDYDYDQDNTGTADAEGASFTFTMDKPAGQVWAASIDNAGDFTLWIDGEKASGNDMTVGQMTADSKPHTLKVTANNPNGDTKRTTRLTIKTVIWGVENNDLDIDPESKWGNDTKSVTITQNDKSGGNL